jgi:hypothetical protein
MENFSPHEDIDGESFTDKKFPVAIRRSCSVNPVTHGLNEIGKF